MQYDDKVIECFLKNQTKLFPEPVAETKEEADDFLAECFATVVNSLKEVWEFFDDTGVDLAGMKLEDIKDADEVFEVGDGRFLIVEC